MNILLINSFLTTAVDDPAQPSPMLSLPYLAAYLKKNGFTDVCILDAAGLGWDEVAVINSKKRVGLHSGKITETIRKLNPSIVGITSPSTSHAQDVYETAEIVKKTNPEILVVVGGAHASSNPQNLLSDKNIDIVVVGEGEETFLDIVQHVADGKDTDRILGTALREDGKIIKNPPRPFIEDLDILPFPDRELLPLDSYSKIYNSGINYAMRRPFTTMISSRGCPGDCIYCAVKTVWGRRWRYRSANNVVDEIEQLINKFGIKEIHFLDDSVSVSRNRLMEICDEIIRRKIDIKWTTPNGIAVWLMDKPLLKRMKQAGCYRLTFGLESGNRETLNFIGKHYNYEKAKEIIKYAHRIGIWTIGTFIIGFPYEAKESIDDTINFALDSYLDFAIFYIANPFPGTKMYDYFKKEGLLPKDESLIVRGVDTKFFTNRQLQAMQAQAFSDFLKSRLKRPWRVLWKIRSFEDLMYIFKLLRQSSGLIFQRKNVEKQGIAALWKK